MNFLIVIPARSGSLRVKNKNIRLLKKKPLLIYTIECCKKVMNENIDTVVSTNCKKIAKISKDNDIKVIMRPEKISTPSAKTEDALLHSVRTLSEVTYDYVICLQPTSPFRRPETLQKFIDYTLTHRPKALMSYTKDRGDYWLQQPEGHFIRLFKDAPRRQQERNCLFEENSSIYIAKTSFLTESKRIYSEKNHGIIIDKVEAFDINTEFDFLVATAIADKVEAGEDG